jgi:ABC-2 type transport system ATP-binding protein
MKSMQLNATEDTHSNRFFTIQMEPSPTSQVSDQLKQLKGVIQVSNPQKNEFIIEYDATVEPRLDLKIITSLSDNHWEYRQISQGKTLEEKLFFDGK